MFKKHSNCEPYWHGMTDSMALLHCVFCPVTEYHVRPLRSEKVLLHPVPSYTIHLLHNIWRVDWCSAIFPGFHNSLFPCVPISTVCGSDDSTACFSISSRGKSAINLVCTSQWVACSSLKANSPNCAIRNSDLSDKVKTEKSELWNPHHLIRILCLL